MTIESTTSRSQYIGNGAVDTYGYNFRIFSKSDLLVVKRDTDNVETVLTVDVDFTVDGVGEESGGTITLAAGDLPNGYELVIRRVRPLTQDTDIRNQGDFFAEVHEDTFDHLIMIAQQQQDSIDRSMKLPETISGAGFDASLPPDIQASPLRVLQVNADGDGFELGPTAIEVSSAQGFAEAADASAELAEAWATKTDAEVTTGAFSSKEYAQGTQAATGGSAKNWAGQTGVDVTGATAGDRSAKSWAQEMGGTGPSAGSSKSWAVETSSTVAGGEYSSKEYAIGSQRRGQAGGGSSKDWASYIGGTVDDTEYSAKFYAEQAATAVALGFGKDVRFLTVADSPVTVAQSDQGKILDIDCSGGNVVVNLPQISSLILTNPFAVTIKKSDSTANTITINRAGTDTFDNADTQKTLRSPGSGAFMIPDTDPNPDNWAYLEFGSAAGGGGGSALQWVEDADSPLPTMENGFQIYSFGSALSQKLYAMVRVPSSYLAGQQIKLRMAFYSNDTTGTALLQSVATLLRTGTDLVTSTTNQRTSTNSAQSQSGTTQNKLQALILDLTDSAGKINGVAVTAGDFINVQLTRGADTAASDVKVPVWGAETTFNG